MRSLYLRGIGSSAYHLDDQGYCDSRYLANSIQVGADSFRLGRLGPFISSPSPPWSSSCLCIAYYLDASIKLRAFLPSYYLIMCIETRRAEAGLHRTAG